MDTSTKFGGQSVDPGEVLLILVGGILNMVIMPIVTQREESGCTSASIAWVQRIRHKINYKAILYNTENIANIS